MAAKMAAILVYFQKMTYICFQYVKLYVFEVVEFKYDAVLALKFDLKQLQYDCT